MFEAFLLAACLCGGDPVAKDEEQLLEVVQTTIKPSKWERKGGKGSGYYWRPGRALVVRQTQDVHEEIDALLKALRNN